MKAIFQFFRCLKLILLLGSAFDSIGQSDSLSIIRGIAEAEIMMEKDFPKAKAACVELCKRAEASACTLCEGRALIMLGKAHWFDGEYQLSVDRLKRGIDITKKTRDSVQWAKAAYMIGNCFYYQAYYDSAIVYFKSAFTTYKKIRNKEGMMETLGDLSLMYHRKGDYLKTVEYIIKTEEMNEELPDAPRMIGDFPGMSNLFSDSLYFREEISDNLKALTTQLKNNNLVAASKIYRNLGLAYNQVKEYATAARYYIKASALEEKLGFFPRWDFVGINYRNANMKDSSFYYHYKAKQDFKRTTQLNNLYTYELLGDAYFHFGQFDSALYNYNIAMEMNRRCNNRITIAGIHRRLVDTNVKLGRFADAERHIDEGITLAKEVSVSQRKNLCKSAAILYTLKGDYKKALSYQNQYSALVDSIGRQETTLHLTRLMDQYKSSKKERELELLKAEHEKKELILKNRNIIMWAMVGITVASIIFIAVFARQRNKIKKKNLALDSANKEQVVLMQEVHHRVKNNLQLIASLINLQSTQVLNAEVARELEKTRSRIMSIALIHQKLYQHENMSSVDLQSFLVSLIENILSTLSPEMKIERHVTIAVVKVEIETAISIGLIVNELITNSIKHGLSGMISPRLDVQLVNAGNKITLTVEDNRPAVEAQNVPEPQSGFGLYLIEILLKRLSGTMNTDFSNGSHTRIEIASPRIL